MQYFLKHDGFLNDKADGYFGANTLAAVKAAQRHYGLVVDGICGPNTWEKIYYVVSRSNYASRTNVSLAAKYMLRCRYGYTVVDYHSSYYGPQTEGAVKDFQDKCGIRNQVVYGRVGRTTWMYLIGSDKDLSLGKSSSGGSGGSDSSSSGGGSGGDKTYLPYPATAVGMAEYANSRVGYSKSELGLNGYNEWCAAFIEHCAKAVGYRTNNLGYLTDSTRGLRPYQSSNVLKGFTTYIKNSVGLGHWAIIWNKTSSSITTIEGNTSEYVGVDKNRVNVIVYFWNSSNQRYMRSDNTGVYLESYLVNS